MGNKKDKNQGTKQHLRTGTAFKIKKDKSDSRKIHVR